MKIYAHMATMPGRESAVIDAIESIRNQVDVVFVNRNPGCGEIPEWDNVVVTNLTQDFGDAAKFHSLERAGESLAFVCDDDLIYPPDIIETLRNARRGNIVVGVHGRRFVTFPVKSYYNDRSDRHRALDDSDGGFVDVIGCGCVLFRNEGESFFTVECAPLEINGRNSMNMGDIHFSKWMRAFGRNLYVAPHRAGWIKHTAKIDMAETIWAKLHKSDAVQTEIVNEMLARW